MYGVQSPSNANIKDDPKQQTATQTKDDYKDNIDNSGQSQILIQRKSKRLGEKSAKKYQEPDVTPMEKVKTTSQEYLGLVIS